MSSRPDRRDLDVDGLRDVLQRQPNHLAIGFGSVLSGETYPHSDLDVIVEVDDSLDVTGIDDVVYGRRRER